MSILPSPFVSREETRGRKSLTSTTPSLLRSRRRASASSAELRLSLASMRPLRGQKKNGDDGRW